MSLSDASQIGRLTAQIEAIHEDIVEMRATYNANHHRLRSVEGAVSLMVEAQKDARRREETQYRRLEVRLQTLSVLVAIAATVVPVALAFVLR